MNKRRILLLLVALLLLGASASMAVNTFRNIHRSQTDEHVTICLWPREAEDEEEASSICIFTVEPEDSEA